MNRPRQSVRRELFQEAVSRMPYWEVWTREVGLMPVDGELREAKQDFKPVHRRKRREMARKLAARGWKTLNGLPV